MKRVICAMSGGVDSSVAAALLKEQGYEVIGVFMKLWSDEDSQSDAKENICCSVEASTAARAVANKLKIPFYVLNFADAFKKTVVDYYIKEYEEGRTPNPCVICNKDIKGEILMKKVLELEGDYLATGHYAQIKKIGDKYHFYQGKDKSKDQTYFLWTLNQEKLAKLLFPVGNLEKSEVRKLAEKYDLPTAQRRESQGICFIPDRDVAGFLNRYGKKLKTPGPVVDISGHKIGTHNGLINYTIGQREHLGLGGPRAYYVIKLDSRANTLVVGDDKDLFQKKAIATDFNWIDPDFAKLVNKGIEVGGRIRYGHPIENCKIKQLNDKQIEIIFTKPQRAITPGQSIVFYDGEVGGEVLGGAVIENSVADN